METRGLFQVGFSNFRHRQADLSPIFASGNLVQNLLSVDRGQRTFDAEGSENGRFFSRRPSVPLGDASGVTIGRGYDMGMRSSGQVKKDLLHAGVPRQDLKFFEGAAGLKGNSARSYLAQFQGQLPTISLQAQKKLFEQICYPFYEKDVARIVAKPSVVARYGKTDWAHLNPKIKEILIDLRYRGDFTPKTRRVIQRAVASDDLDLFRRLLSDKRYWVQERGVPEERFQRRLTMFL